MSRLTLLTALMALAPAAFAQEVSLAFENVTVIDGESDTARGGMTVVVRDGVILSVGPATSTVIPANATVVEGAGRTLMPGLWDTHAHLSYWGEDALDLLIAAGVTSIRELGGDPDEIEAWMRDIEAGSRVGPSMVWCGPFLEGPEGGEEYRLTVATPPEARAAVQSLAARGVDFLKIQPEIDVDVVRALIAEAGSAGLSVVGHLPTGVGPAEGSRLGLRSIEHLVPDYYRLSESELDALFELYIRNGTWMSPALFSLVAPIEARGDDPAVDPRIRSGRAIVRRAHEAGVPLLVGSNFAFRDWPQQPGSGLHGEMRAFVEAGIPAMDVIKLATARAADFAGLGDQVGRIRAGMIADLVLVEGDPLRDIRNTERVQLVVQGGRILHGGQR